MQELSRALKRIADPLARLAKLLREEITGYQTSTVGPEDAYDSIVDWVGEVPDLTLEQVKGRLAYDYGLLDSEVCKVLPRTEKVFRKAKTRHRNRRQ